MTEHDIKLEITPRVVDLGDRIIQLHHVVSVGRHTVYPLRAAGLVVLAAGLGLIGKEVVSRGAAAFALQAGGSLPLWIGFAALGIGLFLLLYVRRVLSIQTSDGRRVELSAASEAAATDLIARVRKAMELAGGAAGQSVGAAVATSAEPGAGEAAVSSHGVMPASSKGEQDPDASGQASHSLQTFGGATGSRTAPAGRQSSYANGHAGGKDLSGGAANVESDSITDQALRAYRRAGSSATPLRQRAQAGASEKRLAESGASVPATGSEPLSLPATLPSGLAREEELQDLHALMEHLRQADVQHKEALLDLLRVVEDHYRGRTSREDALAHWRSFSDYVVQYLGDVDGLITFTERFGRHMLKQRA